MTPSRRHARRPRRQGSGVLRAALAAFAVLVPLALATPPAAAQPGVVRTNDGGPFAAVVPGGSLEPGLSLRWYRLDRAIGRLRPLAPGQTPNRSGILPTLDLSGTEGDFGDFDELFLIVVDGWVRVDEAGVHAFELASDDGSVLTVAGRTVVDNDGAHGTVAVRGAIDLEAGLHPISVRFFQDYGGKDLFLRWRPPGAEGFTIIPQEHLRAPAGEVRVTSPGPKKVILPLERGRPGDGRWLEGVHPSYRAVRIRPERFRPRVGGIDWLSDGRMVLVTWDPDGSVFLLENTTDETADSVTVMRIAAGLAEPLGVRVVDDRIFVLQKQELTELVDLDGDDVIDEYRCVCSGWDVTSNFHEFAFGLVERDGFFYANLAIAIDPGGASTEGQAPDRGAVIRIDPRTGEYTVVARGLRTPNGIGVGTAIDDPRGDVFITDNQGDWLPVSKLLRYREGAFYGSRAVMGERAAALEVDPPVVWLPQGEVGNSPSEVARLPHGRYRGQMVHGDVTHGGLKRTFVEEVDGVLQGCVFRFTQGLEGGVNRVRLGPAGDGARAERSFYVGGIGSAGNWGQTGKLKYGLERLDWTGAPVFEPLAVRAFSNGFEIEMTEPIGTGRGTEPGHYSITRYRYVPTAAYGGPKVDERVLDLASITISPDRRRIFLELDDMAEGFVHHVRLVGPWRSDAGRAPWTTEGWYTLNRVPARTYAVDPVEPVRRANVLSPEEQALGFRPLFDGETLDGWRAWRGSEPGDGWRVENGEIVLVEGGAGDLATEDVFENFELRLEWAIEPGGNSGIMFRCSEEDAYPWQTGPEMQILDNERHPDGQSPFTSAGSLYALYAPEWDATYPPGTFNQVRIIGDGDDVELWLNDELQVRTTIGSPEWNERVADSKFAGLRSFGRLPSGHIVLQDHGDRVRFRNVRVREW